MAMGSYITFRGPGSGPFFQLPSGRPLQKSTFVESVQAALSSAGFPSSQYAGHSFRIGAATEAARLGLEDSVIKALGRWNSSAFESYIRTPRELLADVSRRLAEAYEQ